MQFEGGKAVKKSKRSDPLRYAVRQQTSTSALSLASSLGEGEVEENFTDDIHETEETTQRKPRIRRVRLKKSHRPNVREEQDLLLPGWILGQDLCLPFYMGMHWKKDRSV